MLEPGLADHSFASLLVEPTATTMLAGDTAASVRNSGKKGEGDQLNGSDGSGGSNRCGVVGGRHGGGGGGSGGGGGGLELQQQASGTAPPPPLLPATTTNGDKCEGSATPYTLPHGAYSLPSNHNIFSTSIYTPGLAPHPPPEPRDMFAAPFSALTFPFQSSGGREGGRGAVDFKLAIIPSLIVRRLPPAPPSSLLGLKQGEPGSLFKSRTSFFCPIY
ncbi:hypothetical protein E2C01_038662 [Portunus trituberculatus]|uniref:Uncharacterized protein n=1 Tax=Portunus trituberculatus TaxID=210409 RepID=A0A5B7FBE3_PORTR|nr:hypothetical protein [Portunus trituberculatus]